YALANRSSFRLFDFSEVNQCLYIACGKKRRLQSLRELEAVLLGMYEGNSTCRCGEQPASHCVGQRVGADEEQKMINLVITNIAHFRTSSISLCKGNTLFWSKER